MNSLICTFFGHRDCSEAVTQELYTAIERIIVENNCRLFYVGNHGNFDSLVSKVLFELQRRYEIKVYVVLAYMPNKEVASIHPTILPDGIETVPRKFAIIYRNRWMVDKADIVLTYVKHSFGGAAQFKEYATKKNKSVIELYK